VSNGTLSSSGTFDTQSGTISAVLAGTGALAKTGTGTVTLSGANTYTGATNLSAGTLSLTGSGTLGNAAGVLNLTGGTLDLGTTTQTRTGTITLNGATVSNGTLSSSGTFDTQSGTISAVLAGTGALAKTGTGTVTLSGANTYSGTTTVSAGRLAVNGSIASAVTVANGATLGGTGTVGQTTISSGGIHAPGNSIGTQTVNGAYLLNAGSILEIEVDDAGNSDKVIVNGTVDITGSTLRVKGVSGNNFSGQTTYNYVIIENDGVDAITGDFATIDNQLAFYDAARSTVGGTGNDVSLTLTRNASGFTDIATTPNQKAVAGRQPFGHGRHHHQQRHSRPDECRGTARLSTALRRYLCRGPHHECPHHPSGHRPDRGAPCRSESQPQHCPNHQRVPCRRQHPVPRRTYRL
jgi:autotransporter-associated beta strand protein